MFTISIFNNKISLQIWLDSLRKERLKDDFFFKLKINNNRLKYPWHTYEFYFLK